jgi:hypothetical protein
LSSGDVASRLHSGSVLMVDLELMHTQPPHFELLDLEPPDDRTPDRQTTNRQGTDSAGSDRGRSDRDRANANRAELLRATPGGPTEWDLEPIHGGSSFDRRPRTRSPDLALDSIRPVGFGCDDTPRIRGHFGT